MAEKIISYKDLLESVSTFNSRLLQERRGRIPFYDPSSGITYHDGRREYLVSERGKGVEAGQIITYPSRRWKLRPRPPQPEPVVTQSSAIIPEQSHSNTNGYSVPSTSLSSIVPIVADQNNPSTSSGSRHFDDISKDSWVGPELLSVENAVLEEFEEKDFEFDDDDYDDSASKKKKKQPSKAGKARKDIDYTVIGGSEKPYSCNYCHMCYKTRPGLTYHVTKEHPNGRNSQPATKVQPAVPNFSSERMFNRDGRMMMCDFCESDRPATKPAPRGEKLITCAGCGHSAHPSCLSFSKNQRESTRQYQWKCIECKSCSLCNQAGSDEKLLFCDDCDRGYHMYCVNPPLENTPEGPWSCDPCLIQYGEEAAHRVWKRKIQQEAVARYQMEMQVQEASRRASYMSNPNQQHFMPMQMDMPRNSSL